MVTEITRLLYQHNVLYHSNEGITVCTVADSRVGIALAGEILHTIVDRKTALYLSGGQTPKELYKRLAHKEKLAPGAVGMVDERYGAKWHPRSNELMIKETGLLRYFEMRGVPFYPILKSPQPPLHKGGADEGAHLLDRGGPEGGGFIGREAAAQSYDEKLRSLNVTFQKSVAILGIGADGHTAGIPAADNSELGTKNKEIYSAYDLVTEYNDVSSTYGERVTMTFIALSMMDLLLVLVFGEDKKEPLERMFESGSEEEIPARFYKRPDIAAKTLIITDQRI